jgi:hypothetical protein
MARKPLRGLFITGTDTEVGKTYVAALRSWWTMCYNSSTVSE